MTNYKLPKKVKKEFEKLLERIGGKGWFLVRWKKERKPLLSFLAQTLAKERQKAKQEEREKLIEKVKEIAEENSIGNALDLKLFSADLEKITK